MDDQLTIALTSHSGQLSLAILQCL